MNRIAFIAAPVLTFAYGVIRIIDGLDGERGPGLAWTTGHLAFLAALAFFVPVFLEMRQMLGRTTGASIMTGLGLAGILCVWTQFAIDIVIGFLADDHAGMGTMFDQVQSVPGIQQAIYDFGPLLFFIAQIGLVIQLAAARKLQWWAPLLVVVDLMLPFAEKDLIPVGAVLLLISYLPLIRSAPVKAELVRA